MIKLYHRKNEIAMDFTGIDSVGAIDIYYSGKMFAESMLPNDWQLVAKGDRILCFSLGNSIPELLFEYTGLINIRGATVIDKELNKHPVTIIVEDIDYWENISSKYDENNQYWTSYSSVHTKEKGLISTSIVKNNLLTKPDEFFLADGFPYEGEYHQHQDGQAMSGAEHTDESVEIYRKDEKGKIFNPRKNVTKRQILKILKDKKLKISDIPHTRISGEVGPSQTGDVPSGDLGSPGGGGSGGGYS